MPAPYDPPQKGRMIPLPRGGMPPPRNKRNKNALCAKSRRYLACLDCAAFETREPPMQQTQLDKLLAAPYAEFDRRLRQARLRASGLAGVGGVHAGPVTGAPASNEADAKPALRIEQLVA